MFDAAAGRPAIDEFSLTNAAVDVRAMAYGATVVSIRTPDRDGRMADIVLGFDHIDDYLTRNRYFGAVVGRYGNRIANGRFTLDGVDIQLAVNSGGQHLHGGVRGFDKRVWTGERRDDDGNPQVVFSYVSADGEEGYPGTLRTSVAYTLTRDRALVVDYSATTDRPTIVNLTNHSYFNLAGEGCGDILRHEIAIDADCYLPVDAAMIPTGALAPVAGTPFDFRRPTAIGARIDADDAQLRLAGGYDHTFVVNGTGLRRAARVVDPASGRTLQVDTTEPGVQFYSGNKLKGDTGKGGRRYGPRAAFCLETQHFPDSPNHPDFPSTVLRPGDTFRSTTVFTFGVAP